MTLRTPQHPPIHPAVRRALRCLPALVLLSACAGRAGGPAGGAPSAAPVPAAPSTASQPQVWLLGEVHDNAQGQRQRYELLRRRVEAGWQPSIVMEQFDRDSQALLTKAQAGCLDAACVIHAVGGPGWDWQQYYPVIQLALSHQLPLVAAGLSRAEASRVVRDGVASSFDRKTVAAYHLDQPLPAALRGAQQDAIEAAHCGMVSDMMAGGMVNAQLARDLWMAVLLRAQRPRDAVLIAGNGHARKDIGVGYWLGQVGPALTVRSEGFIESAEPAGRYDAVHLLAPQRRPDPCAALTPKS